MAESSIYMFHGQDFSNLEMAQTGADLMISLPQVSPCCAATAVHGHLTPHVPFVDQRERKRNYDVNEYYREALRVTEKREVRDPRVAKLPQMHDYQFFERDRIAELVEKDNSFAIKRRHLSAALKDARAKEARERKREIRHRVTRFLSAGMTDADAHAAAESEVNCRATLAVRVRTYSQLPRHNVPVGQGGFGGPTTLCCHRGRAQDEPADRG